MRELDHERWVLDIATVDGASLIERFDAVVASTAHCISQLNVRLPRNQDRAQHIRDHLLRLSAVDAA